MFLIREGLVVPYLDDSVEWKDSEMLLCNESWVRRSSALTLDLSDLFSIAEREFSFYQP